MSRQPSDFRQGVEAAAKWLREQDCRDYGDGHFGPNGCVKMASDMEEALDVDVEGTEARTVEQIVQFIREYSFAFGSAQNIANTIERGDWKKT